jgi:hypothetical protein
MTDQMQEPGISLEDMKAVVKIIDAVVQRGAIRGDEMVGVGTVRERFSAFVEFAESKMKEDAPEASEEETVVDAEV